MLDALTNFATENYTVVTPTSGSDDGFLAAFFGVGALFWLALTALTVIGMWKVFVKAKRPGWAAVIPIYNILQLLWTVGRPWWWVFLFALGIIPFVGWVAVLVVSFLVMYDLAKSFDKDVAWALLLFFLPFVGLPMLGFGDAKYKGPSAPATGSGQSSASKKS